MQAAGQSSDFEGFYCEDRISRVALYDQDFQLSWAAGRLLMAGLHSVGHVYFQPFCWAKRISQTLAEFYLSSTTSMHQY
jgi:hypothetical protein